MLLVRRTGDRSRYSRLSQQPGECYTRWRRSMRLGRCIQRCNNSKAPVIQVLLHHCAACSLFSVFFTAVLACQEARCQREVGDHAQLVLLHHRQQFCLVLLALNQVVMGLQRDIARQPMLPAVVSNASARRVPLSFDAPMCRTFPCSTRSSNALSVSSNGVSLSS